MNLSPSSWNNTIVNFWESDCIIFYTSYIYLVAEEDEVVKILLDYNFSDAFKKGFENYGTEFITVRKTIASYCQKLVKLRNQILMTLKSNDNLRQEAESYKYYEKSDFINCCAVINRIKTSKYGSLHHVWDIPTKTTESDVYQDGELTE